MLKALIVDDELASVRSLEILLGQFCKHVDVVGTARNVDEALNQAVRYKPDVVFLDVEMPGGTGFDFLEQCNECNFEVVFISAYNSYAIKAFKYSAVDFILKPIEIDELIKAVDKVTDLRKKHFDVRNKYSALFDNLKEIIPNKLVVTVNGKYEYVDLRDVVCFKVHEEAIVVVLTTNQSIEIDEDFEWLEEKLDEKNFYPISKGCLVNAGMVKKVEKNGEGRVLLNNGMVLPLDSSRRDGFIAKLIEFNKSL